MPLLILGSLNKVHPSCVLKSEDSGLLPDYVVYNELLATPRLLLRNVCAVEMPWVTPIFGKLGNLDVKKLSGGCNVSEQQSPQGTDPLKVQASVKNDNGIASKVSDDHEKKIQAAKERFLARKGKK
ncbi:hypothetical protein AMTR_s00020p00051760 [Amborella trichopoda]|uniref:DEAD-box helicase OB fold domain-containing protein n=1 Tax=Amborella trichopoda TaxID=13333 RepID=W1PUU3_AMBTC|nr:hypothetical protein AMTR_s00020p00051760 [Amborella trichopoda]